MAFQFLLAAGAAAARTMIGSMAGRFILGRAARHAFSSGGSGPPRGVGFEMEVKVEWFGETVIAQIYEMEDLGLDAVGRELVSALRDTVSVPNPGGTDPSKPGEPPKRVTGALYNGIYYEVNPAQKSVDIMLRDPAAHGWHLERGTTNMAPRPWVASTLHRETHRLANAFVHPRISMLT